MLSSNARAWPVSRDPGARFWVQYSAFVLMQKSGVKLPPRVPFCRNFAHIWVSITCAVHFPTEPNGFSNPPKPTRVRPEWRHTHTFTRGAHLFGSWLVFGERYGRPVLLKMAERKSSEFYVRGASPPVFRDCPPAGHYRNEQGAALPSLPSEMSPPRNGSSHHKWNITQEAEHWK